MSKPFELPAIAAWPLAARIASTPSVNEWIVLVAPSGSVEAIAADLADQLESLVEMKVERLEVSSVDDLMKVIETHDESQLVLHGLDGLRPEDWRRVDMYRSRLARQPPIVLVLSDEAVRLLSWYAPNLRSWVGGSVFRVEPEEGLSEERREQRLTALREHFGFDDAELERRARAGALPPEPDIAEWLVLIGRGDLIPDGGGGS